MAAQREKPDTPWRLLEELPPDWLRGLQRFNSAVGEYLSEHATDAPGAWFPFYFQTLAFSNLAEEFGEHSLCELLYPEAAITLRNIVPAHFIAPRIAAADSLVLFSATLNPTDYYTNLLGLPDTTQRVDVASPFAPDQLAVVIKPMSTRRDDRLATLDELVDAIAEQFARQSGNYLAFFSSFDYLELALQRLQSRFGRGYDYTYLFPGLQKVVQAAGRVIRTQNDTGIVVLLDERYREYRYRQLLPGWWKHALQ